MEFFLQIKPPTATAQEKQVRIVKGRPLFYDPAPVKEAKGCLRRICFRTARTGRSAERYRFQRYGCSRKAKVTVTASGVQRGRTPTIFRSC